MSSNIGIQNEANAVIYPTAKGSGGSLAVDRYGRLLLNSGSAVDVVWDEMERTATSTTVDTFEYSFDSVVVRTVTVTYADSTKQEINTIVIT